jgi:hypothetical protein
MKTIKDIQSAHLEGQSSLTPAGCSPFVEPPGLLSKLVWVLVDLKGEALSETIIRERR